MSNYKYYRNHVVITCSDNDYRVAARSKGTVLPERFASRASALRYIDRLVDHAIHD